MGEQDGVGFLSLAPFLFRRLNRNHDLSLLPRPSLPSLSLPFFSLQTLSLKMSYVMGSPVLANARLWHHVSAENRTVGKSLPSRFDLLSFPSFPKLTLSSLSFLVGKLATRIAQVLMGKHKPTFDRSSMFQAPSLVYRRTERRERNVKLTVSFLPFLLSLPPLLRQRALYLALSTLSYCYSRLRRLRRRDQR